ncbi:MAG: hypothetical protein ACE15E_09035 [Acidobacteriota bacterium]
MPKDPLHKVVLHDRDGNTTFGFAYQTDFAEEIRIITREGKAQTVPLSRLKAVFFVRDFKGDPEYQAVQFLNKAPASEKLWVRVRFEDGEVIEGRVNNGLDLLTRPGFYLWPSDSESNNVSIFIPKSAVVAFSILAANH